MPMEKKAHLEGSVGRKPQFLFDPTRYRKAGRLTDARDNIPLYFFKAIILFNGDAKPFSSFSM